jgi:eukaryotic-like serine/threonine-protein kinase
MNQVIDGYEIGTIVNYRYQIDRLLGRGGIASTYQALDLDTNDSVAIKILSLRTAREWKAVELFGREAKVLASLNHPAIPKYLDYFEIDSDDDRQFCIVQSLAPGMPLSTLIENGWQPTEEEVGEIAMQVLKIINYLQRLTPSVIHRDIKPQNIIRSDEGEIYLVDFGAVQDTYHQTITGGSTVVGTYGYMAPEQFRGQAFLSTDLYGLATTLLFLLTRDDPSKLPQKKMKIVFHHKLKLSSRFAGWLDRMLEPASERRFSTAIEALAVLQGTQELPPIVEGDRPRKPPQTPIKAIVEETRLKIIIPAIKLRTKNSQELCMITIIINTFLGIFIYFAKSTATSHYSFKTIPFAIFYVVPCMWAIAYTIYGNLSVANLEISNREFSLKHRFFNAPICTYTGEITDFKILKSQNTLSPFLFDRQLVRIWRPSVYSHLDIVGGILRAIVNLGIYLSQLLLTIAFHLKITKIEHKLSFVVMSEANYPLAFLLTPAENRWLASEINLFVKKLLVDRQLGSSSQTTISLFPCSGF